MPDWVLVALGVVAVPLAVILGSLGVVALAISLWHRGKMKKLEIEEKERQAALDRELLGLGSSGVSAHLETILDRLNNVERRLAELEARQAGPALSSPRAAIGTAEETPTRQFPRQEQRQQT